MSLHSHQTVDGDTTKFKCYRSFTGGRESKSVVYVEIHEGYSTPGWAGGTARRTTVLRLTSDLLNELSRDFAQLAEHGEPDESEWRRELP